MAPNGQFTHVQAPVRVIHSNLDQEVIQITEDKLRLVLNQHVREVEDRKAWIAPLGLVIAILTVFATSNFKDAFFFKAATWEAAFGIALVLCVAWLFRGAINAWSAPSVQDLVERIKNRSTGP